MLIYDNRNWYWVIPDNETQVWSSASASFVSNTDPTYIAWLASGGISTYAPLDAALTCTIEALENSITPRRLRDAILGNDTSNWLKNIDDKIADLRAQLT